MGLDFGVVRITYQDRPEQPMYDFLGYIAEDAWQENWGGGWSGNTFVEFMRPTLVRRAQRFARERQLSAAETTLLVNWVRRLPWDHGTIMLHLNW